MLIRQVSIVEAKANLSRLVESAAVSGDVIHITRNGRPIAQLSQLPDTPAMQPQAPIGIRLFVSGPRQYFEITREGAAEAIRCIAGKGDTKSVTTHEQNGAGAFFPQEVIEFLDVPLDVQSLVTDVATIIDASAIPSGDTYAEVSTTSKRTFRVTPATAQVIASHLASGTPIVGFRPIDINSGQFADRLIYIARAHISYLYANRGGIQPAGERNMIDEEWLKRGYLIDEIRMIVHQRYGGETRGDRSDTSTTIRNRDRVVTIDENAMAGALNGKAINFRETARQMMTADRLDELDNTGELYL